MCHANKGVFLPAGAFGTEAHVVIKNRLALALRALGNFRKIIRQDYLMAILTERRRTADLFEIQHPPPP